MNNSNLSKIKYWYHGTTVDRANDIIKSGFKINFNHSLYPNYSIIDPAYSTYDFGPGLYVSPCESTAYLWAQRVCQALNLTSPGSVPPAIPVVIKINLTDYFNNCHLKIFNKPNRAFANCVKYCRLSGYKNPMYINYNGIYGPIVDGDIVDYVLSIRTYCLSRQMDPCDIPNYVPTQEFQNHFKMNRQSGKMLQLCIPNQQDVDLYINTNIM